jgi:hypothetical protein
MESFSIKALAKELHRPIGTLIALSPNNDPFHITGARIRAAEWIASHWGRLRFEGEVHVRRVHYKLLSFTDPPVLNVYGLPYENTDDQWAGLVDAVRDARYLGLLPHETIIDRKNNDPIIHLRGEVGYPSCEVDNKEPDIELPAGSMPDLPEASLYDAEVGQRYHVEIWCEKTTINDILEPLAERHGCNIITGAGELSLTACTNVVDRAEASGRPVRILYISDFDPGGISMPVAVARKIEFRLHSDELDLDIQVRPIALTHDQCIEYELPRTPIKDTERRAGRFEERFGEGATELDALEAVHPGELAQIVEREICRYYDGTLEERVAAAVDEINGDLVTLEEEVRDQHREELDDLEAEWDEITAEHRRRVEEWRERAKPVWQAMADKIEEDKPDPEDYDWPEPEEGDEDEDPLFDSTRDYVEQIDRYKAHKGSPQSAVRAVIVARGGQVQIPPRGSPAAALRAKRVCRMVLGRDPANISVSVNWGPS